MFYFKKKIFIFFLVLFIIPNQSKTEENLINTLKKGKNIIFIRHSLAPGNGDPSGFILSDCSTQRNLNKKGIIQSKKIGKFFEKNQIPIDLVLSSEWCRCRIPHFMLLVILKPLMLLILFMMKSLLLMRINKLKI